MPQPNLKTVESDATAPAPKRRQSKRGIETERKLLAAANEVFWANGFSGSTIMQIIEASGLSVGSFYHRFSDKEQLLEQAARNVFSEFEAEMAEIDFSRAGNGDLFTLFYGLTLRGRRMVARHRGIYRAMSETAQTDFNRFGTLARITPLFIERTRQEIGAYADQLPGGAESGSIAAAVQLVAMTVMQTELGLGPSFPHDPDRFARTIARACCGILGYVGQTQEPAVPLGDPEAT